MKSWGGEFLDVEWYDNETTERSEGPTSPPEPWRARPDAHQVVMVPRRVLRALCQESYLANLLTREHDVARIIELSEDIAVNGLERPLEVVVSDSAAVVHDGHHRIMATEGIELLPVLLSRSERIPTRTMRLQDLLTVLFQEAG